MTDTDAGSSPAVSEPQLVPLDRWEVAIPLAVAAAVFWLAWARPLGQSPDYLNYDTYFDWVRLIDWQAFGEGPFEPGFVLVVVPLVQIVPSNALVYALLATAAFLPKAWAMAEVATDRAGMGLVFAFYVVRYLPLHELTQLRAAMAIGILTVAWVLAQRREWAAAMGLGLLAIAFHYSALLVVPLLFLRTDRRRSVVIMGLAAFLVARLALLALIALLPSDFGSLAIYEAAGGFGDDPVNLFAPTVLLDWVAIVASMALWEDIHPLMRQVVLIQVIGMGLFYGATAVPVFAHRQREMLSVFWVFFVAQGAGSSGAVRRLAVGFALLSIAAYTYLFVFKGGFSR